MRLKIVVVKYALFCPPCKLIWPMPLLRMKNVCFAYGSHVLMDNIALQLTAGMRLGVLGRNGQGKSTLLKLISGGAQLDSGEIWVQPGIKIAQLEQALPGQVQQSVYQYVASGLSDLGKLLSKYHDIILQSEPDIDEMSRLQQKIEALDGWDYQRRIELIINKLDLPADASLATLSGGWQRKAGLARALVIKPDILLLDEPTNHVDIDGIEWLEKQLLDYRGAIIVITHDRTFLQAVATEIVELDRGNLHLHRGDYPSFLTAQSQRLEIEDRDNALFDKRLAEEERWIRTGIKARRTRNEGRVRRLKSMREERSQRRNQQDTSSFNVDSGERSGKNVFELKNITHNFADNTVVRNFSLDVIRGDRIGLIGPNGCGKSTLLDIVLGNFQPRTGEVKRGTKLQVAHFRQGAAGLDMDVNVCDFVAEGRERLDIGGKNLHIISYLADFLFSAEKARTPLGRLSGGELNRAIFARLFSQTANVLVLDEPTNDLDMETMELLEERLLAYQGTVLLVSHDRQFVDNVVTATLAFEGDGHVQEYVGGYQDYLRQRDPSGQAKNKNHDGAQHKGAVRLAKKNKGRLSYKIQRELEALPELISALEQRQLVLTELMSAPDFYQEHREQYLQITNELEKVSSELEVALERWLELEA